jgi:hypothetical protein
MGKIVSSLSENVVASKVMEQMVFAAVFDERSMPQRLWPHVMLQYSGA